MLFKKFSQKDLLAYGYLTLLRSPYLPDLEEVERNRQIAEFYMHFVVGDWLATVDGADAVDVVTAASEGIAYAQKLTHSAAADLGARFARSPIGSI